MTATRSKLLCAAMAIALGSTGSALAQDAATVAAPVAAPATTSQRAIPGWDTFLEDMRLLPERMIAKLPPELRDDPQVRQELGRLALEALASRSLAAISADPDNPAFLPFINETLNVFQPNADTIYRTTTITPGGTYRLSGTRGTVRMAVIALNFSASDQGGKILPPVHHELNELKPDERGHFSVVISPERPSGYTGDWWKLEPGMGGISLRSVSADWARERDPLITIERLDASPTRPRPSAQDLEKRLATLGRNSANTATFLLDIPPKLRADGYINKLQIFDVGTSLGGLPNQFYYHGAYEISDDEALILEAKVPDTCLYYSTILTNDVFETTDWVNNHSSLNDTQSKVDPDGILRIVISARDPGVPNWLDTAGYARGVVQGRWTECSAQPIPSLRKVALKNVRRFLHKATGTVSLAEREAVVRERRSAYQRRVRW